MVTRANLVGITHFLIVHMVFTVTTVAASGHSLKIGSVLSTTGAWSSLGNPHKEGATAAADRINSAGGIKGKRVEIVFEDDEGDPSKATSLLRKLIARERVCAVFGASTTSASRAMSEVAESQQVPMIAPVPSRSVVQGKNYAFHSVVPTDIQAHFLGLYMTEELKWRRIAVLYQTIEYGISIAEELEKWLKQRGQEVFTEQFAPAARDLSPIWLKIAERKPAGVFLAAAGIESAAIAAKNHRSLNLTVPILAGAALTNMGFVRLAGEAAGRMLFQSGFRYDKARDEEKALVKMLEANFPKAVPNTLHAVGWDSIRLLAKAMETAGCDPQQIRRSLENIRGFQGVLGEMNLSPEDRNGHSYKNNSIVRLEGGKFRFVFSY